jgi:hypothetical protein
MTRHQNTKSLASAFFLLLVFPLLVGAIWGYGQIAPQAFYSESLINVRWDRIDESHYRAVLNELALKHRPHELHGPIAVKGEERFFKLGVFSKDPAEAQRLAMVVAGELRDKLNEAHWKRTGLYPISTLPSAIRVWEPPVFPLAPARPAILKPMLAACGLGLLCTATGITMLVSHLRRATLISGPLR